MDWTSAILGAFLAITSLMAAMAVALLPVMRRRFLLWFALRIACIAVAVVALYPVLLADMALDDKNRMLLAAIATDLSLGLCGPIMADYAEHSIRAPRQRRSLRWIMLFTLLPIALLPAVIYAEKLDWLHDLMMFGVIILLTRGVVGMIQLGSRAACFQAAAWAPMMVLGVAAIGHELLIGGTMPFYLTAILLVISIEFVISGAGLVDGFMNIKVERDEAIAGMRAAHVANATDPLTGIANRRGLDRHFRSGGKRPTGLALIDCDHFKRINDRFGHAMGDKVLIAVAEALNGDGLFEARLGGEEFVLLIYGNDWQSMAEAARRRITQAVRLNVPEYPLPVTASAGLAAVSEGEALSSALKRADRALYAAKEAGRNRSLALTEFRPAAAKLASIR